MEAVKIISPVAEKRFFCSSNSNDTMSSAVPIEQSSENDYKEFSVTMCVRSCTSADAAIQPLDTAVSTSTP